MLRPALGSHGVTIYWLCAALGARGWGHPSGQVVPVGHSPGRRVCKLRTLHITLVLQSHSSCQLAWGLNVSLVDDELAQPHACTMQSLSWHRHIPNSCRKSHDALANKHLLGERMPARGPPVGRHDTLVLLRLPRADELAWLLDASPEINLAVSGTGKWPILGIVDRDPPVRWFGELVGDIFAFSCSAHLKPQRPRKYVQVACAVVDVCRLHRHCHNIVL